MDLRECLERNAKALREEGAALLAETPYCMLTSIPGIGFSLASGIAGELGPPQRLRSVDSLCAFAGITPSSFQTGGPDPIMPLMAMIGPRLKDTLPRSPVKAGLMARQTSLPG